MDIEIKQLNVDIQSSNKQIEGDQPLEQLEKHMSYPNAAGAKDAKKNEQNQPVAVKKLSKSKEK